MAFTSAEAVGLSAEVRNRTGFLGATITNSSVLAMAGIGTL
jgi:hypothetical protein